MTKKTEGVDGKENKVNDKDKLALDIVDWNIHDKIYEIRGQRVMLDYDLARYYGYETRYLNRQVSRNINKFEGENFMFQLTETEINTINLMCHFGTSSWGGTRKLPYAFTEQGIYMLMTVLKGDLATKQSRALVMAFKVMKDYITDSQKAIEYRSNLQLAMKVSNNTEEIAIIKSELRNTSNDMNLVKKRLDNFIERSEIYITAERHLKIPERD